VASTKINLYEAKTQLSSLVERAAKGEEIVIAKSGKPVARLIALPGAESIEEPAPIPFGKNLLGITFLSDDWEQNLPLEMFENPEEDEFYKLEPSE
jgi:prevent-host-death family protein